MKFQYDKIDEYNFIVSKLNFLFLTISRIQIHFFLNILFVFTNFFNLKFSPLIVFEWPFNPTTDKFHSASKTPSKIPTDEFRRKPTRHLHKRPLTTLTESEMNGGRRGQHKHHTQPHNHRKRHYQQQPTRFSARHRRLADDRRLRGVHNGRAALGPSANVRGCFANFFRLSNGSCPLLVSAGLRRLPVFRDGVYAQLRPATDWLGGRSPTII